MKKKLTFLFALLCASVMSWAVQYCDYPTGHESNANFGDANGRILLTLAPTGNANEYKLSIKPNYANGATKKLDYLYVIADGNNPYPAEAGKDESGIGYDALTVTFKNTNATTSFTIQWSNPDWGGRWQCTLADVNLSELSACATSTPTPVSPVEEYDINFASSKFGSYAIASSGVAALAIDGNEGTRWESAQTDDETWILNMGQLRIFNTIKILWEGAYAKEFTLYFSNDGENWSELYVETNLTQAGWQTIDVAKTTAQYIKYHGTKRATGWGQSFFEFQVFLAGASTLTSISLTAAATMAEVGGAGVVLTATPKDQNGQTMAETVEYEITPAAAGHMSGNTYIPDQAGAATIVAYNGSIRSASVTICAYTGANVALLKDVEASGYDTNANLYPSFAVDDNEGSLWSARIGETGDERIYDAWIIVDLGAFYDINLIAIRWEGACSRHYHVDFSADKSAWRTAYNAGWDAVATHWEYLSGTSEDATKVRYVRVWSTEAVSQYGVKIMDLKVFGTEWLDSGDTEAPVMVSASKVSNTYTEAVIAVSATDNHEVARYHAVDATNGIDANYTATDGKITITGLNASTDYNFIITAIDAAGNESANNFVVAVSIPFNSTENLALNKTSEAGYEDGNPAETAAKANDGDDNTAWVTYADKPASVEWWYVDLGKIYNLTNITVLNGDPYSTNYIVQARIEAPAAADKADDAAWVTLATVTDGAVNAEKSLDVSGVGRYVRFHSLAKSANFFRLRELRVYGSGVAEADTEKPVMSSASLVSNTDNQAIIAVAATDNQGIANYHVVDAGNSFDANFVAEAGHITVTGLTGGTTYNFTITAVDYFGNESESSKSVEVTTDAHYAEPQTACPAPTWDASLVKAIYSPTYTADCNFANWGNCVGYTQETYGKKYEIGACGYFGVDGFSLNCVNMEKLHYDIWIADDATIRIVPICRNSADTGNEPEYGITVNLTGQQWNSIDLALNAGEFANVTNWSNVYQVKIDNAANTTIWVANAYFYRETAIVDAEAPTNVSATVAAAGFYSVQLSVSAEDNSGVVSFAVKNGEEVLANGAAATGVATTIIVNNLTQGTNYNFSVVASDEAGNEAAPVAVAATTKALPAPAPAPDFSGKQIVPVFTDATTSVVSGIQTGGWGETTVAQWLDIAANDKVFYVQNFNYAGWHSWGGGNIDATGMQYLHVDVYSLGATSVNVTPISEGPIEGVATISLTPNAWTSYNVPLSAYDANNIDWSNIFQFKFMNPVGGNELIIDNVYFWKAPDLTRNDSWMAPGELGTVCIPNGAVATGGDIYELVGKNADGKIVFATVTDNRMEPGKPYLFEAKSNRMDFFYTNDTPAGAPDNSGAMKGTFSAVTLTGAQLNNVYYFAGHALWGCTDLTESGLQVAANRAWVVIDEKMPSASAAPKPGRRYITMNVNGKDVATGFEDVQSGELQCTKVLINGQLFIIRGQRYFDATGRLVK